MTDLTTRELKQTEGGVSAGLVIAIIAGIIFIVGVIDGYIRPLKCN